MFFYVLMHVCSTILFLVEMKSENFICVLFSKIIRQYGFGTTSISGNSVFLTKTISKNIRFIFCNYLMCTFLDSIFLLSFSNCASFKPLLFVSLHPTKRFTYPFCFIYRDMSEVQMYFKKGHFGFNDTKEFRLTN